MKPLTVRDIMSTHVVTFFAELTLPLAEEVLHIHKFRHLPVIESGGRIVGLVTRSDILKAQISGLVGLSEEERRDRQASVRIADLMTTDVVTTTMDTLAADAARMLLDQSFSCLPVVDADGILLGIVTERDFMRFALQAFDFVASIPSTRAG
jgi:CBS-domain-containing membrane protein